MYSWGITVRSQDIVCALCNDQLIFGIVLIVFSSSAGIFAAVRLLREVDSNNFLLVEEVCGIPLASVVSGCFYAHMENDEGRYNVCVPGAVAHLRG